MGAKLTLKLDKEVIEKAKAYAKAENRSLSRLIESYLKLLVREQKQEEAEVEISPFVKSLSLNLDLPEDFDIKEEYGKHLTDKYE